MSPRSSGEGVERRLFLARAPTGGQAELAADELDHARRVLRLVVGDHVLGQDGAGHAWRLRVADIERRRITLDQAELVAHEPEPGTPDAEDARVAVYAALPRPGPAEEMLDRLTQLGASEVLPLVSARSGPHARDLAPARRDRLERIAREALKQSGRLWMPRLAAPITLADLVEKPFDRPTALLAPRGSASLLDWALDLRARRVRDIALVVGPEGGFTDDEEARLVEAGAVGCRVGRHVLRIETATEAAVALWMLASSAGAKTP